MANANRVNVSKRTKELIHIQFDLEHRHWLFEFCIVAAGTIDGLWDVLEDEIEVDFIFLEKAMVIEQMITTFRSF